jgi:tRNA threonylcarbamoyladenosine modification (KEOPS) complex  Pcc1 subunit
MKAAYTEYKSVCEKVKENVRTILTIKTISKLSDKYFIKYVNDLKVNVNSTELQTILFQVKNFTCLCYTALTGRITYRDFFKLERDDGHQHQIDFLKNLEKRGRYTIQILSSKAEVEKMEKNPFSWSVLSDDESTNDNHISKDDTNLISCNIHSSKEKKIEETEEQFFEKCVSLKHLETLKYSLLLIYIDTVFLQIIKKFIYLEKNLKILTKELYPEASNIKKVIKDIIECEIDSELYMDINLSENIEQKSDSVFATYVYFPNIIDLTPISEKLKIRIRRVCVGWKSRYFSREFVRNFFYDLSTNAFLTWEDLLEIAKGINLIRYSNNRSDDIDICKLHNYILDYLESTEEYSDVIETMSVLLFTHFSRSIILLACSQKKGESDFCSENSEEIVTRYMDEAILFPKFQSKYFFEMSDQLLKISIKANDYTINNAYINRSFEFICGTYKILKIEYERNLKYEMDFDRKNFIMNKIKDLPLNDIEEGFISLLSKDELTDPRVLKELRSLRIYNIFMKNVITLSPEMKNKKIMSTAFAYPLSSMDKLFKIKY